MAEPAILAEGLGKAYVTARSPWHRFAGLVTGRASNEAMFWALRDVSFEVRRGEVVGIVGRNGAGKSTLLQLVCGTLEPTVGRLQVNGRIAALLELGAGFHPDLSGRENVFLAAAAMGLNQAQTAARLDEILSFADIGTFVDAPVRTYSSGMFVRLAFAVATSVDPDILVIDEALSVGDGAFARKSFDRIMELRGRGATILFCSHSLYHVETLCERALWLEAGRVAAAGPSGEVTAAYQAALDEGRATGWGADAPSSTGATEGVPRIRAVRGFADGIEGRRLRLASGQSTLRIEVDVAGTPEVPAPAVAFGFSARGGLTLASVSSQIDGVVVETEQDRATVALEIPAIPLLKGSYGVTVFLLCERGIHVYETVMDALTFEVEQTDAEQGLIRLPRRWAVRTAGAWRPLSQGIPSVPRVG